MRLLELSFFASLFSGLCSVAATTVVAEDKMKIVASFSILGDMVERVVGEHASITTVVGPDADAHIYQPSVEDARSVADADVIFVNGLGFETWSETLISNSGTKGSVYVTTENIIPILIDGEVDSHAWNSLRNGIVYVTNIANVLKQKMPEHAKAVAANTASYVEKFKALDIETKVSLAELPLDKRTVVTAHMILATSQMHMA